MARKSKFKVGQEVEGIFNKYEKYNVVEILKNELIVSPVGSNKKYRCKKIIFEVIN